MRARHSVAVPLAKTSSDGMQLHVDDVRRDLYDRWPEFFRSWADGTLDPSDTLFVFVLAATLARPEAMWC